MQQVIPDIILYNFFKALIHMLRQDQSRNPFSDASIIGKHFKGVKMETFDFVKQGCHLFSPNPHANRLVDVFLGFNRGRAGLPSVHILMPSETPGPVDGIGLDEGYEYDDQDWEDAESGEPVRPAFTRSFECSYSIMITSDNPFEAVMVYNLLRGLVVKHLPGLELAGLQNLKLAGQELALSQDIVPHDLFSRVLSLSFFYESSVPTGEEVTEKDFVVSLQPVDPEGSSNLLNEQDQ